MAVCIIHGGRADQTLERAERRVTEAQLNEVVDRRSRADQLADARYVAYVWMFQHHNAAAKAVLAGEAPDPHDVRNAQLGARNIARIAKLEADVGVDEAFVRNLDTQTLEILLDR